MIYYNLQIGVCTGTTEVNSSHIIYKICTVEIKLFFTNGLYYLNTEIIVKGLSLL